MQNLTEMLDISYNDGNFRIDIDDFWCRNKMAKKFIQPEPKRRDLFYYSKS